MNPPLSTVEVRVLGALAEKGVTTPDVYPLSMAALITACNQSTNRDPVMHLDEAGVAEAVVALRRRSLLRAIQPAGSRVTKYMHLLDEALDIDARDIALLTVLMLRGPQTPGELHLRTARMVQLDDLAQVEAALQALIERVPDPLVTRLPRRSGQKEARYAQLLAGAVEAPEASAPTGTDAAPLRPPASDDQLTALARTVDELRVELDALRADFAAFREQFG